MWYLTFLVKRLKKEYKTYMLHGHIMLLFFDQMTGIVHAFNLSSFRHFWIPMWRCDGYQVLNDDTDDDDSLVI